MDGSIRPVISACRHPWLPLTVTSFLAGGDAGEDEGDVVVGAGRERADEGVAGGAEGAAGTGEFCSQGEDAVLVGAGGVCVRLVAVLDRSWVRA